MWRSKWKTIWLCEQTNGKKASFLERRDGKKLITGTDFPPVHAKNQLRDNISSFSE
jgi:hypothetical protein